MVRMRCPAYLTLTISERTMRDDSLRELASGFRRVQSQSSGGQIPGHVLKRIDFFSEGLERIFYDVSITEDEASLRGVAVLFTDALVVRARWELPPTFPAENPSDFESVEVDVFRRCSLRTMSMPRNRDPGVARQWVSSFGDDRMPSTECIILRYSDSADAVIVPNCKFTSEVQYQDFVEFFTTLRKDLQSS